MLDVLTDFGDSAVLLPLTLALFVWLAATRRLRAAILWLAVVVANNALIGLLKIYFFACPSGPHLHSPSGHTGFAVLVYGAITAIVALEMPRVWQRAFVGLLGGVFVIGIAVSRVALGAHSPLEVVLGGLVGIVSLFAFLRAYHPRHSRVGRLVPLLLVVAAVTILFHGNRLKAEALLQSLSLGFGIRHVACSVS